MQLGLWSEFFYSKYFQFFVHIVFFQEIFLGAGRTLELIETKEIEQLLKTIIDVSTCPCCILSLLKKKIILGDVPLVT